MVRGRSRDEKALSSQDQLRVPYPLHIQTIFILYDIQVLSEAQQTKIEYFRNQVEILKNENEKL